MRAVRHVLAGGLAVGLVIGGIASAQADPIPYPAAGTPNPATYTFRAAVTGDVTAYFAGSGAAYVETVGLLDNGVLTSAGYGLNNHTSAIGQSFDFGSVTAGDLLVFVLDVTVPALGLVYSDPSLNVAYDTSGAVGHNHVYSTAYTAATPMFPGVPTGTYIGFEDLPFPNSDFNYADETYVFTNVTSGGPSNVPEPASIALLGAGLAGLGVCRRGRPGTP